MRLRRFAGTHACALVVLALALLAGLPHQARRPTPETDPKAPELPETTPVPLAVVPVSALSPSVAPTLPPAPVSSPTSSVAVPAPKGGDAPRPSSTPVPSPTRASRNVPRAVPATSLPGAATTGDWQETTASFYAYAPVGCWDASGAHPSPFGMVEWVANKELPCGTVVEISGPAGDVEVPVMDRGPYVAGRALDLSRATFVAVVGTLSAGVASVRWRVVG